MSGSRAQQAGRGTGRPGLAGKRLLIVDDDEGTRAWLAEVFERCGGESIEAASGVEAISALADRGPFDIVVTDVCMPAPSGLQLVAMARTAGYYGPFLLVTAFPDQDIAELVEQTEGTDLLGKPFTANEVVERAARLL